MSALSKVLMDFFKTASCADIAHSDTCTKNAINQLYRFFIANAKYYAPLVALPLLTKYRDLNWNIFEDSVRYYIECILTGTSVGWSIALFSCLFRYLLGEFKYYTFLFLPTTIGALTVYLSSKRVQRLYYITMFQCTIESILIRRSNVVTRTITNSLLVQTLLFMASSSIILYAKQTGAYKGFWLLTPERNPNLCKPDESQTNLETIPTKETTKYCTHEEESCTLHLIKGLRSHFAFGITLDLLKALTSSAPKGTNGLKNNFLAKLRNFKLNSSALLASYIGIYRLTYCFLNRNTRANTPVNHFIASFLNGVCYIFMPKLTLLSYALVLSIQIIWQHFEETNANKVKENIFWRIAFKLPYKRLIFPFCLAHLIQYYCFHSKGVSNLSQMILNNTTDFYAENIVHRFSNLDKLLTAAH